MQKISCLIVEDEPLAAEVLEDYVQRVDFLERLPTCEDAIYALEALQRQKVDLLLLDIHLPKLKGLDFLRTVDNPPKVILTTAYQDYALLGYELGIVDYLLKPIEFTRFVNAVNKARQHILAQQVLSNPSTALQRDYLFFNVGKKKVRMFLDEILYIESVREYIKVVSQGKAILTKFTLGQAEELLSNKNFLRIHRSFIVAKDKVDAFSSTDIEIRGKQLPIGRLFKEQVYAQMEK